MLNKRVKLTKKIKHAHRHKTAIKVGDQVYILAGKDRKGTGEVIRMDRVAHKVWVKGLKLVTKYKKADKKNNIPGSMTKIESSIHISNVKFFDGKVPISIGRKKNLKTKKTVRINKKTKEVIKEKDNV